MKSYCWSAGKEGLTKKINLLSSIFIKGEESEVLHDFKILLAVLNLFGVFSFYVCYFWTFWQCFLLIYLEFLALFALIYLEFLAVFSFGLLSGR